MNYPSVKIVFDRKHKASKTKKGLVQIEILFNRRRKWIGTGIHLLSTQWDDKNKRIKNSPTVLEDNETLDMIVRIIKESVNDVIKETGNFSFAMFSQKVEKRHMRENFIDFFRKNVDNGKRSLSRRSQYKSVISALVELGKIESFMDVTIENIELLEEHYINKELKASTRRAYHHILKHIIDIAKDKGFVDENPYKWFEIPESDSGRKVYLTMKELQAYKNVEVGERYRVAKDFFLIQCYTGLSYSDLRKFDRSCIEERGDKLVILGERIKTGADYYIVLVKSAVEILERYDFKFPDDICYGTMNNHIVKVGEMANINKRITSHIGRHTFAVIALSNGVSIEIVAKILGHKNIRTTQIYASIVDSTVEQSFEKLDVILADIQPPQ